MDVHARTKAHEHCTSGLHFTTAPAEPPSVSKSRTSGRGRPACEGLRCESRPSLEQGRKPRCWGSFGNSCSPTNCRIDWWKGQWQGTLPTAATDPPKTKTTTRRTRWSSSAAPEQATESHCWRWARRPEDVNFDPGMTPVGEAMVSLKEEWSRSDGMIPRDGDDDDDESGDRVWVPWRDDGDGCWAPRPLQ